MKSCIQIILLVGFALNCITIKASVDVKKSEATLSGKSGRFIAFYTSTSETRLITTTITALSTCFSFSANAPVCNGRRKRGIIRDSLHLKDLDLSAEEIDGSLQNSSILKDTPARRRSAKKFTVWTTSYRTLTITSTSYIQGTTVSVSVLCILGGAVNSCVG